MNYDISDLLKQWQFDPNEFTARRIKSKDGTEKIQIRMDLGIMQLELNGRPDGQHPHDHPSLLDYYETINEEISLDEEQCEGLFQEAWQYYHRYLSLFYLEDYAGVVRDTDHVLGIFQTVQKYANSEEVKWYFDQYYPHSIMMQTRAKAMLALGEDDYQVALREIQAGIGQLEQYLEEWEG